MVMGLIGLISAYKWERYSTLVCSALVVDSIVAHSGIEKVSTGWSIQGSFYNNDIITSGCKHCWKGR